MQALVLAGGEGTRLRPLTYTTPKPVMPLAGRPFLSFMLDWTRAHGVDEVVLSCGFMSDDVRRVLGDIYDGMRLRYVIEDEPLGTAGPVRLAYDEGLLDERLFVLNGDVLTDIDLTAELAEHERTGARVTRRATAWCRPTRRGGSRPSSRRAGGRSPPIGSTPAPMS
jgi:mannose-1-phosphate guanylyltransferase